MNPVFEKELGKELVNNLILHTLHWNLKKNTGNNQIDGMLNWNIASDNYPMNSTGS